MPKEKTFCVQFILVLALSILCRLPIEGIPHNETQLGRLCAQQQTLSCKKDLSQDMVSLNKNHSQPTKGIWLHKS